MSGRSERRLERDWGCRFPQRHVHTGLVDRWFHYFELNDGFSKSHDRFQLSSTEATASRL
jgi:hypothetical protein